MSEIYSDFTLVSGVIAEDSENRAVNVLLDDNFTLVCKSYELSRGNKIVETSALSKNSFAEFGGAGTLTLKTKGEVALSADTDFISAISTLSARKNPFTLNVGAKIFTDMLMKSFSAEIDKFGTRAVCSLVFVQVVEV